MSTDSELKARQTIETSAHFKRLFDAVLGPRIERRQDEILGEVLQSFRDGAEPEKTLRALGRYSAFEEINKEVKGIINEGKRATHELKEIQDANERKHIAANTDTGW